MDQWLEARAPGDAAGPTRRDRRVLCLRHGFDGHDPRSRAAVGACLGLTGERVRQIEARALARLREMPGAWEAWDLLGG